MAKQPSKPRTPAARQRAVELRRQQEAAERRRTWMQRIAMVSVLALVGALVGLGVWWDRRGEGGLDDVPGVQSFSDLSRGHVEGTVTYEQTPPTGGDHNGVYLNCGIYDQPVPNENAVHSLEHGAVWITYRPKLAEDDVAKLRSVVEDMSNGYVLLAPYPDLPAPVIASAWGKQLRLTGADDPKLEEFIDTYQRGRQAPEQNGACSGSPVGTPINTPS